MRSESTLETILKRDQAIVIAALAALSVLSWAYLAYQAWAMNRSIGSGIAMPHMQGWSPADLSLVFLMWTVMMVAMMVPSAAPMILAFSAVQRRQSGTSSPLATTTAFVLGYLAVWTAYSAAATLVQWGLHSSALLSSSMGHLGPLAGGMVLLVAGIFQLTPLKHACLHHCRTPLGFLMSDWREGGWDAFVMGLEQGSYCAGCCWALMALMFVIGVMNVLWMALIAGFVLIEKVVPGGDWIGRVTGLVLAGWGLGLIATVFLSAI
jgi:predicted metal-binding membrane protein